MKVVFCTNIWNHHQGPVCTELAKMLGKDFTLLLHQPLDHRYSIDRIKLGWNLIPPKKSWIIGPPRTCADIDYSQYNQLAMDADVLILDSMVPYVDFKMLAKRHFDGKLNFIMSERFFRTPRPWWYMLNPRKWCSWWIIHHCYEAAHIHYLTMGHWVKSDLDFYRVCKGRIYQWGYLTPITEKPIEKPKRTRIVIGWCGRMLFLKQVDFILKAMSMLPASLQAKCDVRIAGHGEAESDLRNKAIKLGVDHITSFYGFMSHIDTLKFLEDLDIFVFPSGRYEGWGATLLEAMDKGCVPVANTAAGATLEVVENGINGIIFNDGNVTQLASHLKWLIENPEARHLLGRKAWQTVQKWSPAAGAKRLVEIIKGAYL